MVDTDRGMSPKLRAHLRSESRRFVLPLEGAPRSTLYRSTSVPRWGFFRDAGLNVTIQDLPGTPKAVQSLLGGSSDLVAGGYGAAIEMAGQGKHLQSVAVMEPWPPFVLLTSNSTGQTRTVRDLKGLTVGIASPGSSTHRSLITCW